MERATGCGSPSAPRPSIVVTSLPSTAQSGVSHEYAGCPSTRTRQAPQTPSPQPNRVPFRPRWLRKTYRSAVSGSAWTSWMRPFTLTAEAVGTSSAIYPELPARARRASKIDHRADFDVDNPIGRSYFAIMRISESTNRSPALLKTIKAVASPVRLEILSLLKDPVANFPPQTDGDLIRDGVCADFIRDKLGIAAATASRHLTLLTD